MQKLFTPIIIILAFSLVNNVIAEVRLPAIIGSHMVLPQNRTIKLWGWAEPGEKIAIKAEWDTATYNIVNGTRTGKWEINIKTPGAGGPYKITLTGMWNEIVLDDVLIGEVWLCGGQSNMEYPASGGLKAALAEAPKATNKKIRFFFVPKTASDKPQDDTKGSWVVCSPETMINFSAVGYFFGKRLQEEMQQPIGLINSNWGGTGAEVWTPAELIDNNPTYRDDAETVAATNGCCPIQPGSLYNSMIHPISKYSISGVIWYQGESNRGNYSNYCSLLGTMVKEWRRAWQYDFPFYYVQIAPFSDWDSKNYVALMRDAQTKCMSIPKSGMVVISDLVDDVSDVHPQNKIDVGLRLANYALAESYGKKDIPYKSPSYKNMKVEKDKIRISFDHADNGLVSKGSSPTEFYIAGEDQQFFPAIAKIEGSSVVVSNKKIKYPVAVRFGFSNEAMPNLFSKEGLPVNLFRTDNWVIPTVPFNQKKNRAAVGAIRWDAWVGEIGMGTVGRQVERSLSPNQYHYRAPFYSKVISQDSIQCRGLTQEIMDKEIEYAKSAGLDYWAFCWYQPHSGLDSARQLYLASKHRDDIKWCIILGTHSFDFNADGAWLVQRFAESNYQKVMYGRPLVYIFPSTAVTPEQINKLRYDCRAASIPDPYVVVMEFSTEKAVAMADSLNADAMSAYISWTGKNGEAYYPLIPKADSAGWEGYKAAGRKVIPWVTTGHNTKPRIDNPVEWTTVPKDEWVSDGTPQQIADNLSNALQWVKNNKTVAEANAVLMYSWNEFDEGGWICPTLGDNTSRLDAIKPVLKK